MNCDQAFDEMTRADGVRSPELVQHLEGCRRCREMFEVLSPALSGLQTESRALARTIEGVSLQSNSIRVVTPAGEQPGPSPRFLTRTHQGRQLWLKALAFFCAGAAIVLAALLVRQPSEPPTAPVTGTPRDECNWIHPELARGDSARSVTLTCMACHLPQHR